MIVNTGCADLTFGQLETNLDPNHVTLPGFSATNVRSEVMDFASSITDKLTNSWAAKAIPAKPLTDLDDFFLTRDRGEQMLNAGATAGIPFLR